MLRITIHHSPTSTTFKLEGRLAGAWVRELEQAWSATHPVSQGRSVIADLVEVTFIDAAGRELLERMHARGVELLASTPLNQFIVEAIVRKRNLAGMVLLTVLLGAAAGRAQDTAGLLRLTLRDAVQMALRQNPQVQIAAVNTAQTQEDARVARSALLPQAAIQASEGEQRFNLQALMGRPFPGIPQHAGPFAVFQGGAVFSAPVLDLTLWRRWRASKQVRNLAAAAEQGVREQITALVISQYLGSLRAAADVKAAQSRAGLAQALYQQAVDLQQAGVGTGIDALRANVQVQNERQRVITTRTVLETPLPGGMPGLWACCSQAG